MVGTPQRYSLTSAAASEEEFCDGRMSLWTETGRRIVAPPPHPVKDACCACGVATGVTMTCAHEDDDGRCCGVKFHATCSLQARFAPNRCHLHTPSRFRERLSEVADQATSNAQRYHRSVALLTQLSWAHLPYEGQPPSTQLVQLADGLRSKSLTAHEVSAEVQALITKLQGPASQSAPFQNQGGMRQGRPGQGYGPGWVSSVMGGSAATAASSSSTRVPRLSEHETRMVGATLAEVYNSKVAAPRLRLGAGNAIAVVLCVTCRMPEIGKDMLTECPDCRAHFHPKCEGWKLNERGGGFGT